MAPLMRNAPRGVPGWRNATEGVPTLVEDDLRPHTAIGVDLEKQAMPESAVDHVGFPDPAVKRVEAGLGLRDHARIDHAAGYQVAAGAGVEVRDEAALVAAVEQDAGRVAQEDELLRAELHGDGG